MNKINPWLAAAQSLAVIIGVAFAAWQLWVLNVQTHVQTQALQAQELAESANLLSQESDKLDAPAYDSIASVVQVGASTTPILTTQSGGRDGAFNNADVEDYISNFEDIGMLVNDNVLLSKMAYEDFSYDVEKVWCNQDIQHVIAGDRQKDMSIMATSDPVYSNFQRLATTFLTKDGETCPDLDNQ